MDSMTLRFWCRVSAQRPRGLQIEEADRHMTSAEIFRQASEHVPALFALWFVIYGSYWVLGFARWPGWRGREQMLDRWGQLDPAALRSTGTAALALISIVSLFMELALIRWVASEIRIFAYFKSLVLIACFLGFGFGGYSTRKTIRIAYALVPLVAMVLLIELPWAPLRRLIVNLSGFIGWFSDVHIFGRAYFSGNAIWGAISTIVALSAVIPLFGLIAIAFVPFGQLVGWYLEHAKSGVMAYSINVFASIVGIWLFTGLSFYSTPPIVWFAMLGIGLFVFFWRWRAIRRSLMIGFAASVILFTIGSWRAHWWGEESWKGSAPAEYTLRPGAAEVFWSPYQKLTLVPLMQGGEVERYVLNTNDSWFQQLLNLSDQQQQRKLAAEQEAPIRFNQYNLPYQFRRQAPEKVLIAGGGMGNDAASAIRNGATWVDAVEIDPLIVSKGRDVHFERPYRTPRVHVHVDDARAFLHKATGQYDLIVFSILDSHTTTSNYTNIRLDNYVYTLESMQATRKLLAPDGVFVMSFSSERPWFAQRLKDVLVTAFEKDPLLIAHGMNFFVVGNGTQLDEALRADDELRTFVSAHRDLKLEPAAPLTDDWPYLYQQYRGIPVVIWMMSIGLLAACALVFRRVRESQSRIDWHFLFLGAAFMLVEVQVISKTALLFGTTWLVNSIVITALLLFILLANLLVSLVPRFPRALAYAGLFITLMVSYLVPAHAIFLDSAIARAVVAMAIYCSPVFFAGVIFISSFQDAGFRAEAFGSNLLGSLVGGLLDSLSFAIGLSGLVLVAALLYLMSLATLKGWLRQTTTSRVSVRAAQSTPGPV